VKNALNKLKGLVASALTSLGNLLAGLGKLTVQATFYALLGVTTFAATYLAVSAYQTFKDNQVSTMTDRSVMIVRSDKRSGGSGVILSSSPTRSVILTNSHVCGVIENGGLVIREGKEHAVVTFRHSDRHDLCLLTVAADFGVNTEIASQASSPGDTSTVIGHPRLMPTVITKGHFSGREIIEIMTYVRECTEQDIEDDEDNALICFFVGGIPIITRFEAQITTSLIQPGSSGSPVLNSDGEVSGLVFAGSGQIGYGFIVPFESVANFVNEEAKYMDEYLANNSYEINAKYLKKNGLMYYESEVQQKFDSLCADPRAQQRSTLKRICGIHGRNLLWRN